MIYLIWERGIRAEEYGILRAVDIACDVEDIDFALIIIRKIPIEYITKTVGKRNLITILDTLEKRPRNYALEKEIKHMITLCEPIKKKNMFASLFSRKNKS